MSEDIVVAVATYRRPELLADLLSSLRKAYELHPFRTIVVDNGPGQEAKAVVEACGLDRVTYLVEPAPGIVPARNRALRDLRESDAWLAFVDDDEIVDENWMAELARTAATYAADVVAGPVLTTYGPALPPWLERGQFSRRARYRTGEPIAQAATNNSLVRTSALAKLADPEFDAGFGHTGGSDSELFWRLRRSGARMVWCDTALVSEELPPERATLRWQWRRGVRLGNVFGRLELRERGRAAVVAGGVARMGLGAARLAYDGARTRSLQARGLTTLTRGIGMIGATMKVLVREYERRV